MRVLGINAVFHGSAAALADGRIVAAGLKCFGLAPVDALALGPVLVRRAAMFGEGAADA